MNLLRFAKIWVMAALAGSFLSACSPHSGTSEKDWPTYLGDPASSHYARQSQIDTSNVGKLQIAWEFHTHDADTVHHSQIECSPIEIGGRLFLTSPRLKLFCIDAATGKQLWAFDPFKLKSSINLGLNSNRGVAFWPGSGQDSSRILFSAGSYLFAVNVQNGRLIETFGRQGRVDLHSGLPAADSNLFVASTSPGMVFHNLYILGDRVSEAADAAPGNIRAFDCRTGALRWTFHTIPQPGEPGYSSWDDTASYNTIGGANNWAGMSLDTASGTLYVPTGSASPDFYGVHRLGMDLFANCLLALDARSGHLKWFYQTVHHDLWDKDLPAPPNLVTLHLNGRTIPAVAQVTKSGFVFILDRRTGTPIYPIRETAVDTTSPIAGEHPWPTQPIPVKPASFVRTVMDSSHLNTLVSAAFQDSIRRELATLQPMGIFRPPSFKGRIFFPGFDGGAEWGGAAYDPGSGWLYINANQVPWILRMVRVPSPPVRPGHTPGSGQAVFAAHCASCHGLNRQGGADYPSLVHLNKRYTPQAVIQLLQQGRRMMPAFPDLSSSDKLQLLRYLFNLSPAATQALKPILPQDNGSLRPQDPVTLAGYQKFRTPNGYPASPPPWGTLMALNLNTGKYEWNVPLGNYPELHSKQPTGTENYGGPIVTSGGLLFIAASRDGFLRAFNKTNGQQLWKFKLPAPGFATPCTYLIKGKQYVVIACGGGKLETSSSDTYMAFALP